MDSCTLIEHDKNKDYISIEKKVNHIAFIVRHICYVYIPMCDNVVNKVYDLFLNHKHFNPESIIEYIYQIYYIHAFDSNHYPPSFGFRFHRDDNNEYNDTYKTIKNVGLQQFKENMDRLLKINKSDPDIYIALGIYYGVTKEKKIAMQYLFQATLFGNVYASFLMAEYYLTENIKGNSGKEIITLLSYSIDNGDLPEAMYTYASLCFFANHCDIYDKYGLSCGECIKFKEYCELPDEQLIEYCKLAANNGIYDACDTLGKYYFANGDYANSMKYYTKACKYGNNDSIYELSYNISNTKHLISVLAIVYNDALIYGKKEIIGYIARHADMGGIILGDMHMAMLRKSKRNRTKKDERYLSLKTLNILAKLCETAISEKIDVKEASYMLGVIYSNTKPNLASHYYHIYIDTVNKNNNWIQYVERNDMIKAFCEKIKDHTLMKKIPDYKKKKR